MATAGEVGVGWREGAPAKLEVMLVGLVLTVPPVLALTGPAHRVTSVQTCTWSLQGTPFLSVLS